MLPIETHPRHESVEVFHRSGIIVYVLEIRNLGVKSPLECAIGAVGRAHISIQSEILVHFHLDLSRIIVAV